MTRDAIVWDLDNCLSDDGWRIGCIEWRSECLDERYRRYHRLCSADSPGAASAATFAALSREFEPVFVTGRPEWVRGRTEAWIATHLGVRHPTLIMRPDGDRRSSVQLKVEEIERCEGLARRVAYAFDDHVGIVEAYRTHFGWNAQLLAIHALDAYNPPRTAARTAEGRLA